MNNNNGEFSSGFILGGISGILVLTLSVWLSVPWSYSSGNATFSPKYGTEYNRCVVQGNSYPEYETGLIWCSNQFRTVQK